MTLNALVKFPDTIKSVEDDFSDLGVGIVHFGVGAFHRAHQAVYTHDILAMHGGDWRILGISLQSTHIADALNQQDGIYSLVIRGENRLDVQLIKSIASVEAAARSTQTIFKHLVSPDTHIVSMTVTEKAYGILRNKGTVDQNHPSIAYDLENNDAPKGIIGMIVKGLKLRMADGLKPFTVLCCDNLPQNGDLVRSGILDFAVKTNQPELAKWIEEEGAFPNSMVDRITPATTPELIAEVTSHLGVADQVPIETEPFFQWVVEDNFVTQRPKWEEVGALFVEAVEPYEHMKLRMLNGSHSLIAYLGFGLGHKYVRDAMGDDGLIEIVKTHMESASKTLAPLKDIDFGDYSNQLIDRFKNPNIAHETYQIAMDGSQKMPQRIFEPAVDAINLNVPIHPFALATAAWIEYCSGQHKNGETYSLRDPREEELSAAYKKGEGTASSICKAFFELPDLFPKKLIDNENWKSAVEMSLSKIIKNGLT